MSRVVWSSVELKHALAKSPDKKRQTTLDGFAKPIPREVKNEGDASGPMPPPVDMGNLDAGGGPLPDDTAMWGPSGGGNRETQGRRGPVRFMNGRQQSAVFDESPYSRDFIRAWRNELQPMEKTEGESREAKREPKAEGNVKMEHDGGVASQSASSSRGRHATSSNQTTEFASFDLLKGYLGPNCPRTLFQGHVFFLNSCDSDPIISVYLLEKLIRLLGGVTSMGVSSKVSYVVTQHLCSAKESKVQNRTAGKSDGTKYVHPHFVLACAKAGAIVPVEPYTTIDTVPVIGADGDTSRTRTVASVPQSHELNRPVVEAGDAVPEKRIKKETPTPRPPSGNKAGAGRSKACAIEID